MDDIRGLMQRKMAALMRASYDAAVAMGMHCPECKGTYFPQDEGVDPWDNSRKWFVECCGVRHEYVEKAAVDGVETVNLP